jgi:hypothetical protein
MKIVHTTSDANGVRMIAISSSPENWSAAKSNPEVAKMLGSMISPFDR